MTGSDRSRSRALEALDDHLHAIDHLGMQLRLDSLVASELSLQQLKVMLIAVHRAPATAHDVALALGVSAATVSGIVGRLVDHGLLVQEESPHDRRTRLLRPTPAGERAVSEVATFQLRARRAVLERLTDAELAALELGVAATERAMREYVAEELGSEI